MEGRPNLGLPSGGEVDENGFIYPWHIAENHDSASANSSIRTASPSRKQEFSKGIQGYIND